MKKKLLAFILCVSLALSGSLPVYAAHEYKTTTEIPGNETTTIQERIAAEKAEAEEAAAAEQKDSDTTSEDMELSEESTGEEDGMEADGEEASTDSTDTFAATPNGILPIDGPTIYAESAIVINVDTGDIFYEKNAHQKAYPASVAKIMTGYIAAKEGNVSDVITASENVLASLDGDATNMAIMIGEKVSFKDLLYGMLLASANDASLLLADHISGSESAFVEKMNQYAKDLGCEDTNFENSTGLSDEKQLTTVYDTALISAAAYQNPVFNEIIKTAGHYSSAKGVHYATEYWNGNQLIYTNGDTYYPYATGGKTGYTEDYKANLVSYAEKNGMRIAAVVFGCSDMDEAYEDTIKIFDFAFDQYHFVDPLQNFTFEDSTLSEDLLLQNHYAFLTHELPEYYLADSSSVCTRNYITSEDFSFELNISGSSSDTVSVGTVEILYQGSKLASVPIKIRGTATERPDATEAPVEKKFPLRLADLLMFLGIACFLGLFVLMIRMLLKSRKTRVVRINSYRTPPKAEASEAAPEAKTASDTEAKAASDANVDANTDTNTDTNTN